MVAPTAHRLAESDVRRALDTVIDPELDEPITNLGFVRSVSLSEARLEVHLRLPTSFCSPNFAYLMASDAKDALVALDDSREVVVELDDHHDSDIINTGLASDAGYRGTFRHEAEQDLDELRLTFQRKAHTAAMERALTSLLRSDASLVEGDLYRITITDLPAGRERDSLVSRRAAIGLSIADDAAVLVDDAGQPCPPSQAALYLRRARSVRISVEGNAHFCRGLLTTRYPGSDADQTPRASIDHPLLPLLSHS